MARVEKTIEVDVPIRTAYNQWTQFEEFPSFMEGVHEVRQIDNTHLHWRANVGGREKEWDAVIREQVPDQKIIWVATDGAENAGLVKFDSMGPAKTRVHLEMSYDPEGFVESVGNALGFVSRKVQGDLERFKDFVEARGTESGAYRREHHNPTVPGGHTMGEPARNEGEQLGLGHRAATAATHPHDTTTQRPTATLAAPSEISATDVFNRPEAANARGSQETGTGPDSTSRAGYGDPAVEARTGFGTEAMRDDPAFVATPAGEGELPYGEETPDVAGEYTGSSIPVGSMADPDREGRARLETPGAMQPGSKSREAHQRAGLGGGPTADASSSGLEDLEGGEGQDGLANESGERRTVGYPDASRNPR